MRSFNFLFCRKYFAATLLFCCVFGVCVSARAEAPHEKFDRANRLYQTGNYAEAAEIYDALASDASLAQKEKIYFNLGNSRYRLGQLSLAILNYERVLDLNPRHADAKYNLRAAKAKLEYKIEDRRDFFIRFQGLVLGWIKTVELRLAALSLSFLFLLLSLIWLSQVRPGSFWVFPRLEIFSILLLVIALWGSKVFYEMHYQEAIVLATEADVHYGPSRDNQSLMKLGGGLKVFVVDRREEWSRVLTWNGETGWMRNSDLGQIKT